MSGRTSRRIAIIAAATAVAIPLSFAAAGSASAAESPLDGLSSITGEGGLPVVGGLLGGDDAGLPVVGGLLGGVTGSDSGLPVVGGLLGEGGLEETLNGLPIAGPLLESLGLTGLVGDLVDTVTGVVGSVLGNNNHDDDDDDRDRDRDHDRGGRGASVKPVKYENTSLPHTGGDADMTAILMCAGLAVAGTGVTLVSRRRRSALAG